MNILRKIVMAVLFCCGISFAFGQKPYLDSLNLQVGTRMEINLCIYDYVSLPENVGKDIKSLRTILQEHHDIPAQGTYTINYQPGSRLSIKPGGVGDRVIWENGTLKRYPFDNQLFVGSPDYLLNIQFNDPSEILSDDLPKILQLLTDTAASIKCRETSTYHFTYQDLGMKRLKEFDKPIGQKDVLILNGGVGVNLVKNQPVVDISAALGLMLSRKGGWKNQYYVSYSLLSDFSDPEKIRQNAFLSLGYRYNLSKNPSKSDWLGVEAGYLVKKSGDLFRDHTFRLGFNWEVGKYISVAPQIYFSGDLKEVFPAVRLGFGF